MTTPEEAVHLAAMLTDILDAGYDITIRRDGARGTGQNDVRLRPQYVPGEPGYEPGVYPVECEWGFGETVYDAVLIALPKGPLGRKYGWEDTLL